eukprot:1149794-Prymnesium_polylepis.1
MSTYINDEPLQDEYVCALHRPPVARDHVLAHAQNRDGPIPEEFKQCRDVCDRPGAGHKER